MSKQLYGKMKNQLTSNFLGSHLMIYTYVLKHQSLVYAVGFILVLIRFFFFFFFAYCLFTEKEIEGKKELKA